MSAREVVVVVDRVEGAKAVVVADDGRELVVSRRVLPAAARREGAVIRVRWAPQGEPDWKTARVDEDEERRRREDVARRLDRLRRSDPGGDVSL